ncbi:MAG TPA: helicase C-terminal domain-containing protein [Candidatus Limnocylindria bacterium]|jgi:DNA polymerase-3 subunit epsilon/ATP-dependent DNA helicase DinG
MRDLIAVDLETTGFDPDADRIVEIGAVRLRLGPDGPETGERFSTLVDPGRPVGSAITRLTGIRDDDLAGAPRLDIAMAAFLRFAGPDPCFLGHNVGFDLGFLERAGLPGGADRLDTADLASILLPMAPSYALQRLAADARIDPGSAHRALDDALTCAAVLGTLASTACALPADVLAEAQAYAPLVSGAAAEFFGDALAVAVRHGWDATAGTTLTLARPDAVRTATAAVADTETVFGTDGPLARALPGYEDRPEQRALALEIERTEQTGGVLVAEAGTGIGKSLAYLVPALARAAEGERVIVSTHTLPLQDQLMRHDLPALQAALGTDVPVAVLKGRSNYLCPRRWQLFRGQVATREEARLLLKTLIWRTATAAGDRAELNLLGGESGLWPRISADDESCTARRCAATRGGCHLERARAAAATSGIVIVNHALLLHDARAGGSLLPDAEHVIVDEAHRLEDVASDAFGYRFETWRARRDLDRIAHSPLVGSALRGGDAALAEQAETLRSEVARAQVLAGETFAALATLLDRDRPRLRITNGVRAGDERWLGIELAAERLVDALAAIRTAGERLLARAADEDEVAELEGALKEHIGTTGAISHAIHDPREGEITWLQADGDGLGLYVAPAHVGAALRRTLVDRHRSVVLTSATLGVAGTMTFALERFGVSDVAASLQLGSPFDHAAQSAFIVPTDIALPHEERFGADAAGAIADIAHALDGRTLVLFTAHGTMREIAGRLGELESAGIAVLTQGIDGSRRAILERFAQGRSVLLGTQSFWEGVDLPGDLLRCVIIAKLPFPVPDDPLVQGRAERYEDPFTDYHLPQAALRLRQGYGRLIRTRSDRGAVVLLDRRILVKEYGPTFLASLPSARVQRVGLDGLAAAVAPWAT